MGRGHHVIAGVLLAALLATAGSHHPARRPRSGSGVAGQGAYCLPTDGVSVGHVCLMLG